jgi:hypothetical protein
MSNYVNANHLDNRRDHHNSRPSRQHSLHHNHRFIHLQVPISHMWSPAFVPRCKDWPSHVDVVGEFRPASAGNNANAPCTYTPAPALQAFLDECPDKPIYIG